MYNHRIFMYKTYHDIYLIYNSCISNLYNLYCRVTINLLSITLDNHHVFFYFLYK